MKYEKREIKRKEEYVHELSSIVSELDNLRAGFYVSPRKIDMRLSKLPIAGIRSIWKKGKKEILELEMGLSRERKFQRYVSLSFLFRNLSIISISFIGGVFALSYSNPSKYGFLLDIVTNPLIVIILVIIIPNIYFVLDYISRNYVKEHFSDIKVENRRRIKLVINELLTILVNEIKKYNVDTDKIKLRFFYTDYKYIKVLKKPNIFRKYYIVTPKVKK